MWDQVEVTHAVGNFLLNEARRNSRAPVRPLLLASSSVTAASMCGSAIEHLRRLLLSTSFVQANISQENELLIYNYPLVFTAKASMFILLPAWPSLVWVRAYACEERSARSGCS